MLGINRSHGFTLPELIISLAIAAITTSVVIPGVSNFVHNTRLSNTANQFLLAVQFTRSTAITHNETVVMCKSVDGERCATNGGWEQGWIVFTDVDENNERHVDELNPEDSEPLLRVFSPLPNQLTVSGNKWVRNTISYQANGFPPANHFGGTLFLCDHRGFGEHARAVIINKTGRPFITRATDKAVNNTYRKEKRCVF